MNYVEFSFRTRESEEVMVQRETFLGEDKFLLKFIPKKCHTPKFSCKKSNIFYLLKIK